MSPSRVRLEGLSNSSSSSLPVWCARCAPGSERKVRVERLSLLQSWWPELRSFVGEGDVEPGVMPGSIGMYRCLSMRAARSDLPVVKLC